MKILFALLMIVVVSNTQAAERFLGVKLRCYTVETSLTIVIPPSGKLAIVARLDGKGEPTTFAGALTESEFIGSKHGTGALLKIDRTSGDFLIRGDEADQTKSGTCKPVPAF